VFVFRANWCINGLALAINGLDGLWDDRHWYIARTDMTAIGISSVFIGWSARERGLAPNPHSHTAGFGNRRAPLAGLGQRLAGLGQRRAFLGSRQQSGWHAALN